MAKKHVHDFIAFDFEYRVCEVCGETQRMIIDLNQVSEKTNWETTKEGKDIEHPFDYLVKESGMVTKQLDQFAKDWILQRSFTLAKAINLTTMDALRRVLSEGFEVGESIAQLSNRVESYFTENAKYRAEMVSRTEVIAASNAGAVDRYEKEGIQQKEWFAALDERTRETHLAAHGQIVGINEDFKVGGDSMSAPGQGSDPSENINCRCTVLPVV